MTYVVRTNHIQELIANAQILARKVNRVEAGTMISLEENQRPGSPEALVEHALCKAISDLRHAAAELDAERLNCYGWAQR